MLTKTGRLGLLRGVPDAWFVLGGAFYLLTGLAMIAAFAWPQPFLDQFRLYPIYLELPFPENVLQRENGHRPIIPGLIRVLEIHWLGANQMLQIAFGAFCALATALCAAWIALREDRLARPLRLAGAMLAVMAVFWLGNAQYGKRDYAQAIGSFRSLVTAVPDSPRAPEAMLSLANSQLELKDAKGARKTLDDLLKTYPKSEAAQAARERIAALK